MPATQYNPSMTSTQQGMYQMHQQPTTYTQGYNNPPLYFNTSAQSQRPPSGGGQSNMGSKKERKNRIRIIDPNTGQDVAVEDVAQKMSDSGSRSTPVGSSEVNCLKTQLSNIFGGKLSCCICLTFYLTKLLI